MIINFLGDSITYGVGASKQENNYVSLVGSALNCTVNNYGVSGTRIAHNRSGNYIDEDFQMRAPSMDKNADYVFVFGGTNDFGHGDGALGDLDSKDPYTFCGGLNRLISLLLADYDRSNIIFILPMHRHNENSTKGDMSKPEGSPILKEYVDCMKTILNKNGFAYINLFDNCVIKTPPSGESEFFVDGLHPNDFGHAVIAGAVVSYVERMEYKKSK